MSKRKTTAEFIEELNKINPDVEVLGEYMGTHTKILCKCKICENEWESVPSSLLGGCGCPKCGTKKAGKAIRKSKDDFIRDLLEVNPNIEALGEYVTSKTKILCKCKVCENEWEVRPNNLLNGRGCPSCSTNKCGKARRKSKDDFVRELREINSNIEPLEDYTFSNNKILFACKVCGHTWKATPSDVLQGHSCPECSAKKVGEANRTSKDDFVRKLREINPNIEMLEEYATSKTKILCRCKVCGNEWKVAPNGLLKGYGCPSCAGNMRVSYSKFIARLYEIDNTIKVLTSETEYKNTYTRVACECLTCGNTWETVANHLLRGTGCKRCYFNSRINPDLTDEERLIRRSYPEYKEFIHNVLARDKYVCQLTFGKKHDVVVHHLDGYDWCKEGRLDPNNAITINTDIHKEFHKKYGYGKNTKQQFVEFASDLYKENRITRNAYERLMSERLK